MSRLSSNLTSSQLGKRLVESEAKSSAKEDRVISKIILLEQSIHNSFVCEIVLNGES